VERIIVLHVGRRWWTGLEGERAEEMMTKAARFRPGDIIIRRADGKALEVREVNAEPVFESGIDVVGERLDAEVFARDDSCAYRMANPDFDSCEVEGLEDYPATTEDELEWRDDLEAE
jgi:hypothetical protein